MTGKCGNNSLIEKFDKEFTLGAAPILPLLPSNGKHSLLIVKKKEYQKLLQKDERRRKEQKLIEDMKIIEEKNKYLNTAKILAKKRKSSIDSNNGHSEILNRRATVFFKDNLQPHDGDTADNVGSDECL